jgi:hypothetical protein
VKINEVENELTRRISTGTFKREDRGLVASIDLLDIAVVETIDAATTEQEHDLRRHSHIGTFRRGLSESNKQRLYDDHGYLRLGIDQNEAVTTTKTTTTTTTTTTMSLKGADKSEY